MTEQELITKLAHVGLPVHGTYDELLARYKANFGVVKTPMAEEPMPKAEQVIAHEFGVPSESDDPIEHQHKKRGRPWKDRD